MNPTRAVVTGASSGIGKAMAKLLAEQGINLVLTARRQSLLTELASELKAKGLKVDTIALDLSSPGAAQELLNFSTRDHQSVDFLINNAGAGPYRPFLRTGLTDHQSMMQLNMGALTDLCHLFGNHMLQHGRPSVILNVASVASYQAVPNFAVYSASKFYVRIFSEIFRHEMAPTNVSVSCLCPGGTATEFLTNNNQQLNGRFSPLMDVQTVARAGIAGALSGKAVIVPGLFNKLSCLFPRLLPSAWNISLADRAMRLAVREKDS